MLDLHALEAATPRTHAVVRTTPLGRVLPREMAIDRTTGCLFVAGWVIGPSGIFSGPATISGSVSMLDTRSGRLLHTTTLGTGTAADAVAVDEAAGRVYVLPSPPALEQGATSHAGVVSVLDARTGRVVRTITAGAGSGPHAVDAQTGRLFLAAGRHTVGILATRSGAVLLTVDVGQDLLAMAVEVRRGRVIVVTTPSFSGTAATTNGRAVTLDARSGAVLGTATIGLPSFTLQYLIGGTPQAVAVDEPSGQVFVANFGRVDKRGTLVRMGSLSVLDGPSRVLRTVTMQTMPVALGLDSAARHLVATTRTPAGQGRVDSGVSLLDVRSGAVRGQLRLDGHPLRAVLDEGSDQPTGAHIRVMGG